MSTQNHIIPQNPGHVGTQRKRNSGLGIAGFVLAMVSILLFWVPIIGTILCLLAVILSLVSLIRARGQRKIGLPIAGLAVGAVFLILSCAILASIEISDDPNDLSNTEPEISASLEPEENPEPSAAQTLEPESKPTPAPTQTPEPTPTPEPTRNPEEIEAEYKSSCQTIGYKDLCRNPDEYEGTYITIKVKVAQVMTESLFSDAAVWRAYTDDSGYGWYLDDEYYLVDKRPADSMKILEDDIIIIYGEFVGMESVIRSLTLSQDEVPRIEVKYLELIEEEE